MHGDPAEGLAGISWRDRRQHAETQAALRHLFLFVGAEPETGWLKDCGVAFDAQGFVLTGDKAASPGHAPAPLDASVPGVFAVGDVRSGSVKRVGGAIGEGAAAVSMIHQRLAAAG